MKTGLLYCAILIGCLGGAKAEAPFAPHRSIADHVITMRSWGGTRIVTSGAGWFRVDTRPSGTTQYYSGSLSLSVTRLAPGGYAELAIAHGTPKGRDRTFDHEPYQTSERQVHLGESCRVWNVMRSRIDTHWPIRKYSCVTDDGLELWYRWVGDKGVISSAEATKIERRPVPAGEVQPARDILDLNAWATPPSDGSASSAPPVDFASEMKSIEVSPGRSATTVRTTLRHHPWVSVEDHLANGGLILSFENSQTRLVIHFESEPGGEYRKLSFARMARDTPTFAKANEGQFFTPGMLGAKRTLQEQLQKHANELRERLQKGVGQAKGSAAPVRLFPEAGGTLVAPMPNRAVAALPPRASTPVPFKPGLSETVLSESCTWFDMTPGLMDGGFSQCRTGDGIALKEDHWSRGGRQVLEAVRLERRAVALDEVLPAAEILSAETWGLPK